MAIKHSQLAISSKPFGTVNALFWLVCKRTPLVMIALCKVHTVTLWITRMPWHGRTEGQWNTEGINKSSIKMSKPSCLNTVPLILIGAERKRGHPSISGRKPSCIRAAEFIDTRNRKPEQLCVITTREQVSERDRARSRDHFWFFFSFRFVH